MATQEFSVVTALGWVVQVVLPNVAWIDRQKAESQGDVDFEED